MKIWFHLRLKIDLDHHLRYAVRYRGYSQNPFPSTLLRYFYRFDRRGKVTAGGHPIPDLVQVILQILLKICYRLRHRFPLLLCSLLLFCMPPVLPVWKFHNGFVLSIGSSHCWLTYCSKLDNTDPFAPLPLQELLHYYGLFRPYTPHRYSHPCGSSTWISPFTSES